MADRIELMDNGSATSAGFRWKGGKGTFSCVGTFNSGTITLQYLAGDGSTWVGVSSATAITADGMANFECAAGQIRALVTGSPSAIYAHVISYS